MKKKVKKRNYFFLNFVKVTGCPAYLLLRPKVYSIGNTHIKDIKGGAIIAANHTSFFDPLFGYCVFWRRNLHLVATKDLFCSKWKDFFFRNVQCIKIDKENFSMNSFHEIKEVLSNDKLVMIFPEGKVNAEKEKLLPFKSGTILMAYSANKPIIPLYIHSPKKWYGRWYGVLGEPIDVRKECGSVPTIESINKVSDLLREKEEELKNYFERIKNDKRK